MPDSKHSAKRMRQRGISRETVELIFKYGDTVPVAGGADLCLVPQRKIAELIEGLKRKIRRLESLKNAALIVDGNGNLITVEHHTRRHRVVS